MNLNDKLEIEKRLKANCLITPEGHWIWQGACVKQHGVLKFEGRLWYVHRLAAFVWLNFNIYSKKLICHKIECNQPKCFNPDHIYEGNHSTNTKDVHTLKGVKKICKRGHIIEDDPYIRPDGRKRCRQCMLIVRRLNR